MTVALLVIFYPDKAQKAFDLLKRLMKKIPDGQNKILIVNISPQEITLEGEPEIYWLPTPSNWEFSGWAYLFNKLDRDDLTGGVIFANDTFCHHRPWSLVDNMFFRSAILNAKQRTTPALAGEICSLGSDFGIRGATSDHWISSYLFYANRNYAENLLEAYFDEIADMGKEVSLSEDELYFSSEVTSGLATVLKKWMDPTSESSWRPNETNIHLLETKTKIILCEMYFSFYSIKNNTVLVDCYGPRWSIRGIWRILIRKII